MKGKLKNLWPNLNWLLRISEGLRLKAVLNMVLGIVQVLLDFASIWAMKRAVDIATSGNGDPLLQTVMILAAIVLSTCLLGYLRSWVRQLLGARSRNLMQLKTFSRLMHSVWTGRDSMHSGDAMNRLIMDSNTVTRVITDTFPQLFCVLFRLAGAFLYFHSLQPNLAWIMLCIAPLFLLMSRFYVGRMRKLSSGIRDTESRIQSILQENLQNRMVIKTLEKTDFVVRQLSDTQDEQVGQIRRRTRFSSVSGLVAGLGFALGYLVTFTWGVFSLRDGIITYGTMMAFMQLVNQIQWPFRSMTSMLPEIIEALVSTDRLRVMEQTPLEDSSSDILLSDGPVGICLDAVSFCYSDGDAPVLKELSHNFEPGSFTAVVGETGAGKTTLIRLILALLKPQEGSVWFYDSSARVEASASTRCNLVYVPQGNTLMSGTVRANLLLGNPDADDSQMEEALRTACADFVMENGQGLDMVVGEGGCGLSEGQSQRIAVARSLLRGGSVLLLDEVTSSLDQATEKQMIENISARASAMGQTVIFITHRDCVLDYCQSTLVIGRT